MISLLVAAAASCAVPVNLNHFEVSGARDYQVADLPIDVAVRAVDAEGEVVADYCGPAAITGLYRLDDSGTREPVTSTGVFAGGVVVVEDVLLTGDDVIVTQGASVTGRWERPSPRRLPGWLSLLPPLIAIAAAMVLRRALVALFAGIWLGATLIEGYRPLLGLLRTFDTYLPAQLADTDHAAIILFTFALGGMVGLIAKSGGTKALVDMVSARAGTRRAGLLTSWAAGLIVFFDDYANCLLVGSTVRPFTDSRRISREKLSYLVDSTAAPVATVALMSTWIGYQLGLIDELFETVGVDGNAYDTFLSMLPYSFYSFLTILFTFLIAATMRDFGPMLRAERRAVDTGELVRNGGEPMLDPGATSIEPEHGRRLLARNAAVPLVSMIAILLIGLYVTGRDALGDGAASASLREIIAASNSYAVLLWASFGGSLIALLMAASTGTLTLAEGLDAWVAGVKSMLFAVLILVLAWAIGSMCKDYLQTGPWLLSQIQPSPAWLPALTFAICAGIALATGSSFSTMAIVIPIAGPMAWALTGDGSGIGEAQAFAIRHATLAAVLGGAVFGDHCSPISDTTIMSSMATGSDHIDHVKTQAPYAALCAVVAGVAGYVPAGFGLSPWISLGIGAVVLGAVIAVFGRRVPGPR